MTRTGDFRPRRSEGPAVSRELLSRFPTRRDKPEDGMAVTAHTWEAAHEYRRQRPRFHDLLRHGPGILTGLDVIATDPADSTVYVLPGVAVDPCGGAIAFTHPMACDLGAAHGLLYLLLTYAEMQHPLRPGHEDDLPTIDCHFGIEATVSLPEDPYVELARVRRGAQSPPVRDARDPLHPVANELDLRYRPEMGLAPLETISIAASYAGEDVSRAHGRGAGNLARALRQSGPRVWVDDKVPVAAGLGRGPRPYTLLYLVGQDSLDLSWEEMIALNDYIQGRGTVPCESCRAAAEGNEPAADALFKELLAPLGIQPEAVPKEHDLLVKPHPFTGPPPGFESTEGEADSPGGSQVAVAGGVIFSRNDYGCLWAGDRQGWPASRDEIRTAMERGDNMVAYPQRRRTRSGAA